TNDDKNAEKKEYDARAYVYKNKLNSINAMRAGGSRDHAVAELKAMEGEINEFRTAREKELQDQALRLRSEIVSEITAKINALDRAGNNFILDRSGQSLNGVPILLFAPANADMSERVISALNGGAARTFLVTRDIAAAAIDMNEVFKQFNKTKNAESKINEAKNAAKKEYDERAAAYKDKLNSVNAMQAVSSRAHDISEFKATEHELNTFC